MTKPSLKLPNTLRFPQEDEVPVNSSVMERFRQSKTANIVPGYTLQYKDDNPNNEELNFDFYTEINVDNDKLWDLFISLSHTLPENCSLIFGPIDFEVSYGKYDNKDEILDFLKTYETELTQDTFLNFGIIYHDAEKLIEIFIDESKYIKYWGVDEQNFKRIMSDFGLNEIENLEFIDEYPKVRENLNIHYPNTLGTHELIKVLKEKYL